LALGHFPKAYPSSSHAPGPAVPGQASRLASRAPVTRRRLLGAVPAQAAGPASHRSPRYLSAAPGGCARTQLGPSGSPPAIRPDDPLRRPGGGSTLPLPACSLSLVALRPGPRGPGPSSSPAPRRWLLYADPAPTAGPACQGSQHDLSAAPGGCVQAQPGPSRSLPAVCPDDIRNQACLYLYVFLGTYRHNSN
jgi:hypothetical protein